MKKQTYTRKEIDSKINLLDTCIYLLKTERTELSKSINEKEKQLNNWKEFDLTQGKLL